MPIPPLSPTPAATTLRFGASKGTATFITSPADALIIAPLEPVS
jgi:hypothetical protein